MTRSHKTGITLIETLVYLALFTIVVGGLLASAYAFFESTDRNQTKAMIQSEQEYLIAKINWALGGARLAALPSASELSVTPWEASLGNPIEICLSAYDMRLSTNGVDCITEGSILNNSNVSVRNLVFIHHISSGIHAPESIEAGITLTMQTPDGMTVSRVASTTRYVYQ